MSLLLQVIRNPEFARRMTSGDWNRFMRETRSQRLCARVSYLLQDHHLQDACPAEAWTELSAQRFLIDLIHAETRTELNKVRKAFTSTDLPIMLLKGAAYVQAGLRFARGRRFADLDIMVPHADLSMAENLLVQHGWQGVKTTTYDQGYYRRWMHELPPMRHPAREIELDVHHAILPLTNRLRPNTELLWSSSTVSKDRRFRLLCPEDMFLHASSQLFQDGEIRGQFPGLWDLHQLASELGVASGFWERLIARAEQLQLGRPLYYGLHFSSTLLGTAVPEETLRGAKRFASGLLGPSAMRTLVPRALLPRYPTRKPAALSGWLLYIRSHWLRMPPLLLSKHLLTKALRGRQG